MKTGVCLNNLSVIAVQAKPIILNKYGFALIKIIFSSFAWRKFLPKFLRGYSLKQNAPLCYTFLRHELVAFNFL